MLEIPNVHLDIRAEIIARPLKSAFVIARGAKTEAHCLVVRVTAHGVIGQGEGVPYPRYNEDAFVAATALNALGSISADADLARLDLGYAAQNALDCAIIDWAAKHSGQRASSLLGLDAPAPVITAQTLSLGEPLAMAENARQLATDALIKIKLGGSGDLARLAAIRAARPQARLIVDANEGWSTSDYQALIPECLALGVEMIEQPFHADNDGALASLPRPIPICADEAAHNAAGVAVLKDRYDMVNIKLDKTGGIRPALAMVRAAQAQNLPYMIGCMVGSSLSMAPAMLLAKGARYVDLDGPLFLAQDVAHGIKYENGVMHPYDARLWG